MWLIEAFYRWRQQKPKHRGLHVEIEYTANFVYPQNVRLGDYVYIGPECYLEAKGGLDIGDGTILGPRVSILTSSHRYRQQELLPYNLEDDLRKVTIGRGVWICYGALICPGVTIEDGAVIGMGALITKPVKKGQVMGGNPAQQIARRPVEQVEQLVQEEAYFLRKYQGKERDRKIPILYP